MKMSSHKATLMKVCNSHTSHKTMMTLRRLTLTIIPRKHCFLKYVLGHSSLLVAGGQLLNAVIKL